MTPIRPRRQDRRGRRGPSMVPALIVTVGLAATALLVALLLQRTVERPASIAERAPPPDFAGLLPAGSEISAGGALEIPDVPQPAFVVGYLRGGIAEVGLIAWDRRERRYALVSTVRLEAEGIRMIGVPMLSFEPIGNGSPALIVARGSAGAYMDGVFILVREPASLAIAPLVRSDGVLALAAFQAGSSVRRSAALDIHDIDNDGDQELVATTAETGEDGRKDQTVEVYVWADGRYVYDRDLSWAMATSKSVFPEPPAR